MHFKDAYMLKHAHHRVLLLGLSRKLASFIDLDNKISAHCFRVKAENLGLTTHRDEFDSLRFIELGQSWLSLHRLFDALGLGFSLHQHLNL
jgi:hypothetical protein